MRKSANLNVATDTKRYKELTRAVYYIGSERLHLDHLFIRRPLPHHYHWYVHSLSFRDHTTAYCLRRATQAVMPPCNPVLQRLTSIRIGSHTVPAKTCWAYQPGPDRRTSPTLISADAPVFMRATTCTSPRRRWRRFSWASRILTPCPLGAQSHSAPA